MFAEAYAAETCSIPNYNVGNQHSHSEIEDDPYKSGDGNAPKSNDPFSNTTKRQNSTAYEAKIL